MKKLSKSFWTTLKITSVFIAFFCLACQVDVPPTYINIDKGIPEQQADSIYAIMYNGERIESEFFAQKMDIYTRQGLTLADSIMVKSYDEYGNLASTLTARQAEVNDTQNIITAIGNVILVSDEGTLYTEKLIWNRNNNKLNAPLAVKLVRGDDIMYGTNMRTNLSFDFVDLEKVSAQGTVRENMLPH